MNRGRNPKSGSQQELLWSSVWELATPTILSSRILALYVPAQIRSSWSSAEARTFLGANGNDTLSHYFKLEFEEALGMMDPR